VQGAAVLRWPPHSSPSDSWWQRRDISLLADAHADLAELLARQQGGDWGEVVPEDARENQLSVREGFRMLSSYPIGKDGAKVWIITEAQFHGDARG